MHWLVRSSSFSKAQGLRETGSRSYNYSNTLLTLTERVQSALGRTISRPLQRRRCSLARRWAICYETCCCSSPASCNAASTWRSTTASTYCCAPSAIPASTSAAGKVSATAPRQAYLMSGPALRPWGPLGRIYLGVMWADHRGSVVGTF